MTSTIPALQNFRTYELSIVFYRECKQVKLPHSMNDQLMITLNTQKTPPKHHAKNGCVITELVRMPEPLPDACCLQIKKGISRA